MGQISSRYLSKGNFWIPRKNTTWLKMLMVMKVKVIWGEGRCLWSSWETFTNKNFRKTWNEIQTILIQPLSEKENKNAFKHLSTFRIMLIVTMMTTRQSPLLVLMIFINLSERVGWYRRYWWWRGWWQWWWDNDYDGTYLLVLISGALDKQTNKWIHKHVFH